MTTANPKGGTTPPFRDRIDRALRPALTIELIGLGSLLCLVLVIMATTVAQRYLPVPSSTWLPELARFAVVWLTFLGIGYLISSEGHIALLLKFEWLSARAVKTLDLVATVLVGVVSVVIAVGGFAFVQRQGGLASPALGLPMGWVYGAALAGFGLAALHALLRTMSLLATPAEELERRREERASEVPGL